MPTRENKGYVGSPIVTCDSCDHTCRDKRNNGVVFQSIDSSSKSIGGSICDRPQWATCGSSDKHPL